MEVYRFDEKKYYRYDDVVAKYPTLKKGCRNKAAFIKKHGLEKKHYLYARLDKKGVWQVSEGNSYRFDKLFLRKVHVDNHMVEEIEETKKPERCPPIIILSEKQGFFDDAGNKLEIEIVGERSVDLSFFKLKDISVAFQLRNLANTVTHTQRVGFQEGVHYRRFSCIVPRDSVTCSKSTRQEIYLTYLGVLRVIFTTRSHVAESFVAWATNTLFTAQLGTMKQKRQLASALTGLDLTDIKKLNKATSGCISCVYLFSLGKVQDLRETMSIPDEYPDESVVYKYGRTNDLLKRTQQHLKTYGVLDNVNLELVYHAYIDPEYASSAETTIAHNIQGMELSFSYGNHKELIIVSQEKYKYILEQYDIVGKLYRGSLKQILDDLEKQKQLVILAQKDAEILVAQKEIELSRKDTQLAKQETEMMKKDLEIMRLKLQLAEIK